jgi:thiol-disulfide isomerase/thioredoxin
MTTTPGERAREENHDVKKPIPTPLRAVLAGLALAMLAAAPAAAQQADAVLRDFQPTGDYLLEVAGQDAPAAEIYQSDRVPAFLIVTAALPSPTLLLPREGSVQTVSIMKLAKRGSGSVDILADAELSLVGRFRLEGEEVLFAVDGRQVKLKPRPYLLGSQSVGAMLDYSPEYRRRAGAYRPDSTALAALDGHAQPVRVLVYFGSWCSFCKQYVPLLLKVAEELEGSRVAFEFYGLPRTGFNDDPRAQRDDVHAVPTGIVFVGGREAGRIEGAEWQRPEQALRRIVSG